MEEQLFDIPARDIEELLSNVGKHGFLGEGKGYQRGSYSNEETAAKEEIRKQAKEFGLETRYDPASNLLVILRGKNDKTVFTGSHLDTVPNGGNFDGAAGVVCGLLALHHIQKRGIPEYSVGLVGFSGEESAFFKEGCKGARAALGFGLSENILDVPEPRVGGLTIDQALMAQQDFLRSQGQQVSFSPIHFRKGNPAWKDLLPSLDSYVELHIEQGPTLEMEKKDIGIVGSIWGTYRFKLKIGGEQGHSGTVPWNMRRDANYGQAEMLMAIEAITDRYNLIRDQDIIRCTPPIITTPQKSTTISDFCEITFDIRSPSLSILEPFYAELEQRAHGIAARRKLTLAFTKTSESEYVERLDPTIQVIAEQTAARHGYSSHRMPSGASHDAVYFSKLGLKTGMIFVPSIGGHSHRSDEYTPPKSFAEGANILTTTLDHLANRRLISF